MTTLWTCGTYHLCRCNSPHRVLNQGGPTFRVVFRSNHELESDSCSGENSATGIQWMKGREANGLPCVEVLHNEDKEEILISYPTWQLPGHS